ncbi:LamG-like jellyroll fold domain-containing protein [Kitasatospora sp. NPDC058965]|uniref:LamG-like jellyroll fold domain-containing protein n=1 Tax=Kitasatospora sp. NPDC058965 TaxID=3346682 RepID=UPI0036855591
MVDSLTTENSRTTANPDGSFTWTSDVAPSRVKTKDGWTPVDTTLVANSDGTVTAKAVESAISLSGGGNTPLATLENNGARLSFSWPTALPKPTLSGDTALYASVLPGVDLQVTVDNLGGFEDVLIVHDAAAAANPALKTLRLGTTTKDLRLSTDSSGSMRAEDASGKAVFTSPPARMWDSSTAKPKNAAATTQENNEPSTAHQPGSGAKTAQLPLHADQSGISIVPDPGVLGGPGISYPVYIDPTVTPTSGNWVNHWTWEQSCSDPNVHVNPNFDAPRDNQHLDPGVGLQTSAAECVGTERAFLDVQFPAELQNSGAYVLPGRGKFYASVSGSAVAGSHTSSIRAFPASAISPATTWANKACTWDISSGTCQDMPPAAVSSVTTWATTMFPPAPIEFDMTSVVQNALNHGYPNLVVGLFNSNELDSSSFVRVATTNHTAWDITYDLPPQVTGPSTTPWPHGTGGANTCPGPNGPTYWLGNADNNHQANLSVGVSSPTYSDGNTNQALSAAFYLNGSPAPGSRTSATSFQASLNDATQYSWYATANDGYLTSSPGPTCYFTTDFDSPNQPQLDTGTPSSFIPGGVRTDGSKIIYAGDSTPGTINITDTDNGPSGIWCYEWTLDNPNMSVPTTSGTCTGGENGSSVTFANGSGQAPIPIASPTWGTHVLRVLAVDRAGNFSASPFVYGFYVPDNPDAHPAPGDVTGDGVPDILTPTPDGDLRIYQPGTGPASGGLLAAAHSPASTPGNTVFQSPDGTGWNNFQVTAHGSMHGLYTDDLFAHRAGAPNLYLYLNNGAGQFNTAQQISFPTQPGCSCDWSRTGSIAAVGWPDQGGTTATYPGGSRTPYSGNSRNPTYLLAVGPVNADGTGGNTLWLYPYKTVNTLGAGINIGTAAPSGTTGFDWGNQDLLTPGDATGDGLPDLWTRDRTTGTVYQFASLHNGDGSIDLGALGGDHGATVLMTGMTPAANPILGSSGDLNGDLFSDLWGSGPGGSLVVWTGQRNSSGAFSLASTPVNLSDVSWTKNSAAHTAFLNWQLGNATLPNGQTDWQGSTEVDTSGLGNNGTIIGGVTRTNEHDGGAARFDGSTGAIQLPNNLVSASNTLTVSLWFKTTGSGTLFSTGNSVPGTANPSGAAMPVLYVGTDGKLYGHFWNNTVPGIASTGAVNDGTWHHVALTGANTVQILYLDGHQVGSLNGQIANVDPMAMIGAGVYNNYGWPAAWNGNSWNYFTGQIDDLQLFDRALNPYEITNLDYVQLGKPLPPVISPGGIPSATVPAATNPSGPGCLPNGPYGTVNSLTPKLQAIVADADPTVAVKGEFEITDTTAGGLALPAGAAGSDSATVNGAGTVGITTPLLSPSHTYAWRVRTVDANGAASVFSPLCHFTTYATGTAPTTGPVSEWKLNEGQSAPTATADASGNNHPATLNGPVSWSTDRGGSALFDGGINESVATSGQIVDTAQSFSVTAWARLTDLNTYYPVASQTGANGYGFWLGYDHNLQSWALNTINADTGSPSAWYSAAGAPGSVQAGSWYHLVATFDLPSKKLQLYVNGVLQTTRQDTWPTPFTAPGPFMIGNSKIGVPSNAFNGGLTAVRLYNRVLSQAEITQIYTSTGDPTTGLAGRWRFTDGPTSAADSGTPGGSPATAGGATSLAPGGYAAFAGFGRLSATPVVDTSQSFSAAAWAKLADTTTYHFVLAQAGTSMESFYLDYDLVQHSWAMVMPTNDTSSPGWTWAAAAPSAVSLNAWTHLVGTFDASTGTIRIYVNGKLAGTGSTTSAWNSAGKTGGALMIGAGNRGGTIANQFTGGIADARLYQQSLTADQVLWLYQNTGFTQASPLTAPTALTSSDGTTVTACSTDPAHPATVGTGTAVLGATVSGSGVHADFDLRDVTNPPATQPLVFGQAGSAGSVGTGSTTVTPALTSGHLYAFAARSADAGHDISAATASCYLQAGASAAAPSGAASLLFDNTLYPASTGATWSGPVDNLVWQGDGNLVVTKKSGTPIWSSNTGGHPGAVLVAQNDGNLAVYPSAPTVNATGQVIGTPLWTSGTADKGANNLVVQTDGNVVLYGTQGSVWNIGGNVQSLTNTATGNCLDSSGSSVYTGGCNGGGYQSWQIIDNGDGTWSLKDSASGNCLDGNGTSMYAMGCNFGGYQRWYHSWGGSGWILKQAATGLVLDSMSNGTPYFNQLNGGGYQQWR